jgi:peptide-methionine (S)-S-oxide reductase
MLFNSRKLRVPAAEEALPGRDKAMPVPVDHFVLGTPLQGDTTGLDEITFGMGCFWGAEQQFWNLEGVVSTAVGYAGGLTPNPTYEEVCSGRTGHTEVVRVVYDPNVVDIEGLLKTFWEGHDPTQEMRQGPDVGTQYRSAIYVSSEGQLEAVERSRSAFQQVLSAQGYGKISTEVAADQKFYFAEGYHQQYLAKNPGGYCGHGGTGVTCPVGVVVRKS